MSEKVLGKIKSAEIQISRGFLFGPIFQFGLGKSGAVGCGGKYTVNLSDGCKWESEQQKADYLIKMNQYTYDLMKSAKVECFSKLVGMPVEVELENRTFKNFRILTEVI